MLVLNQLIQFLALLPDDADPEPALRLAMAILEAADVASQHDTDYSLLASREKWGKQGVDNRLGVGFHQGAAPVPRPLQRLLQAEACDQQLGGSQSLHISLLGPRVVLPQTTHLAPFGFGVHRIVKDQVTCHNGSPGTSSMGERSQGIGATCRKGI
jgi:hypothetical protein